MKQVQDVDVGWLLDSGCFGEVSPPANARAEASITHVLLEGIVHENLASHRSI